MKNLFKIIGNSKKRKNSKPKFNYIKKNAREVNHETVDINLKEYDVDKD